MTHFLVEKLKSQSQSRVGKAHISGNINTLMKYLPKKISDKYWIHVSTRYKDDHIWVSAYIKLAQKSEVLYVRKFTTRWIAPKDSGYQQNLIDSNSL